MIVQIITFQTLSIVTALQKADYVRYQFDILEVYYGQKCTQSFGVLKKKTTRGQILRQITLLFQAS